MVRDDLSPDYVKSILDYEKNTGLFRWRRREVCPVWWNGKHAGKIAGCPSSDGHIRITLGRRSYFSHRLAWVWMLGAWPAEEIDHIDGNPSNNRWENLREASHHENTLNTRVRINNKSGFKGVSKWNRPDRWAARITLHGRIHFLGIFYSPEEASAAYQEASIRLHGKFGRSR